MSLRKQGGFLLPALPPSTQGTRGGPTRKSAKGGWTPEQVNIPVVIHRGTDVCLGFHVCVVTPVCRLMQDELLRRAVHHHGGRNWKQVGTWRTSAMNVSKLASYIELQYGSAWQPVQHTVTSYDCAKALMHVRIAAEYFEDRTDVQCLHRWQKVLNPELVKGPWTKEVRQLGGSDNVCTFMHRHLTAVSDIHIQEDDKIASLVGKLGAKRWSLIAQELPGRIGKQCRERYLQWHLHFQSLRMHNGAAFLHTCIHGQNCSGAARNPRLQSQ